MGNYAYIFTNFLLKFLYSAVENLNRDLSRVEPHVLKSRFKENGERRKTHKSILINAQVNNYWRVELLLLRPRKVADSDPAIIPYKVLNHKFTTSPLV